MDLQSILSQGLDFNKLAGNLNNINPQDILSKFGYNQQETKTILKGDMSPILEKNTQNQILDFSVIMSTYGNLFNQNLITYFYKKSKEKKAFTEDEITTYFEPYNRWFEFVFKIGSNFIFQVDEELKDRSVLIRVGEDVFQMSKIDNVNAIICVNQQIDS
jgi:hypothetical protein